MGSTPTPDRPGQRSGAAGRDERPAGHAHEDGLVAARLAEHQGLTSLGQTSVYFADTFGITGAAGSPGSTFSRKNPFASVLREPDRRIDYVFVRGPDETGRGEPLDAQVCFDAPHEGNFASDHFGVIATISTE